MQNGQFRTSCRSKVIHQCWKRLVLYIATARLVKFIFKSEQLHASRSTHPHLLSKKKKNEKNKRDDSRDADDCLRDLPEWSEEFTDNPEDTQFSGLRFGTSWKKWYQNQGSTTCVLTSQETIIVGSASERRSQGTLA